MTPVPPVSSGQIFPAFSLPSSVESPPAPSSWRRKAWEFLATHPKTIQTVKATFGGIATMASVVSIASPSCRSFLSGFGMGSSLFFIAHSLAEHPSTLNGIREFGNGVYSQIISSRTRTDVVAGACLQGLYWGFGLGACLSQDPTLIAFGATQLAAGPIAAAFWTYYDSTTLLPPTIVRLNAPIPQPSAIELGPIAAAPHHLPSLSTIIEILPEAPSAEAGPDQIVTVSLAL